MSDVVFLKKCVVFLMSDVVFLKKCVVFFERDVVFLKKCVVFQKKYVFFLEREDVLLQNGFMPPQTKEDFPQKYRLPKKQSVKRLTIPEEK